MYGRFVRSGSTVIAGETVKDKNSESSDEESDTELDFSNKDTLEKAFEMSGGRTAHKAARHGHKLNGKLKRLQEQENAVHSLKKRSKMCENIDSKVDDKIKKGDFVSELKNEKLCVDGDFDNQNEEVLKHKFEKVSLSKSKEEKKSKKKREKIDDKNEKVLNGDMVYEAIKFDKKCKGNDSEGNTFVESIDDNSSKKKKKKKKKKTKDE